MQTIEEKQKSIFETLKDTFGYTNVMRAPRIEKVVVAVGTGSIHDKKKLALIQDRIARITGQKAVPNTAKKSIAGFKLREGNVIGYQVTLRGKRMEQFVDKLIHVALPRTRDFRGLPAHSFDEMNNYSFGIKEHTIFPETSDEELKDVFGFGITIVTTAQSKEEARALLDELGFPIRKEEEKNN